MGYTLIYFELGEPRFGSNVLAFSCSLIYLPGYCKRPGECRCKLGFYGEKCNKCIPLPGCQHGYCNVSFECICKEGWDGLFCSEREFSIIGSSRPRLFRRSYRMNRVRTVAIIAGLFGCKCFMVLLW